MNYENTVLSVLCVYCEKVTHTHKLADLSVNVIMLVWVNTDKLLSEKQTTETLKCTFVYTEQMCPLEKIMLHNVIRRKWNGSEMNQLFMPSHWSFAVKILFICQVFFSRDCFIVAIVLVQNGDQVFLFFFPQWPFNDFNVTDQIFDLN